MSDNSNITGSRDDLRIDCSRCLRMRFSESGCELCVAICPHGAIHVDNSIVIDFESCRGCLLCTTVCPSGALEPGDEFFSCLKVLAKVHEPVLGCIRTKDGSHASLTCLGGLSAEHLMALIYTLSGNVTLNLSRCADCSNASMLSLLRQRFYALSQAGLADGSGSLIFAENTAKVNFHSKSVDRRSFFKLFRRSLVESAAMVLSAKLGEAEMNTPYGTKRLPVRRELQNQIRGMLTSDLAAKFSKHFDFNVTSNDSCATCQGCVAICPTGALHTIYNEEPPVFDQRRCTGCGLCEEFCLDNALSVQTF